MSARPLEHQGSAQRMDGPEISDAESCQELGGFRPPESGVVWYIFRRDPTPTLVVQPKSARDRAWAAARPGLRMTDPEGAAMERTRDSLEKITAEAYAKDMREVKIIGMVRGAGAAGGARRAPAPRPRPRPRQCPRRLQERRERNLNGYTLH